MTEAASKELCEELERLSGWNDTSKVWSFSYEAAKPTYKGKTWHVANRHKGSQAQHPAYGLGYLLRKLPAIFIATEPGATGCLIDFRFGPEIIRADADTPEDAAAKLCIELFKQGVLKKNRAKEKTS